MSYDLPRQLTYSLGLHDFGAGAGVRHIKAPTTKQSSTRGKLVSVAVDTTEAFTADTTAGFVRVGTAADPDAFAELNMSTALINVWWSEADDTDAIIDADIPAGTIVEVDFVAPTGGTPAGIGYVYVSIDWY